MKKISLFFIAIVTVMGNLEAQEFPEMMKVEGGTFLMGNPIPNNQQNESPAHQVTLSTFWIAKTETTVLQWKVFCKATGRQLPAAPVYGWNDDAPIANINWNDATEYVKWLSRKTCKNYRLPTEAEWEFAARGGNLSKGYTYSGANDPALVAWFSANSSNQTQPVARKQPNELGVYDMTGNVWEWTNDIYKNYDSLSVVNPQGAPVGNEMVFRGGGIMESEFYIRVAMRGQSNNREYSYRDLGLRVVCDSL